MCAEYEIHKTTDYKGKSALYVDKHWMQGNAHTKGSHDHDQSLGKAFLSKHLIVTHHQKVLWASPAISHILDVQFADNFDKFKIKEPLCYDDFA